MCFTYKTTFLPCSLQLWETFGGLVGEGGLVHLGDKVCIFVKVTSPMIPLEEMGF